MIFSYSYFSVYQPCICEISQIMNNPLAITEYTKIESVFNRKVQGGYDYKSISSHLVILTKILNSYKNLLFSSFISRKDTYNY
jgi:hypothetical protein